jgi:hypothetical protein
MVRNFEAKPMVFTRGGMMRQGSQLVFKVCAVSVQGSEDMCWVDSCLFVCGCVVCAF